MKVKYLIIRCTPLNDQYECDADRTPICLVDDWKKWEKETNPNYYFEVYKCENGKDFEIVKEYDKPTNEGMALYYWTPEEYEEDSFITPMPHVIKKWPDATRNNAIPQEINEIIKRGIKDFEGDTISKVEFNKWLKGTGVVSWVDDDNNWWHYGSYADSKYDMDC